MRWSTRPSVTIRKSKIRNWKVSERIFLYIRNHNWLCKQKKWKLVGSMTSSNVGSITSRCSRKEPALLGTERAAEIEPTSNADMPISRIRPPSWIGITWLAHFRRARARYFSSNTTWQRSKLFCRELKRWRIIGTSFNHGKTRLCRQVGKQDMIQTSEDSKYCNKCGGNLFCKAVNLWISSIFNLVTADWTESSRPYL